MTCEQARARLGELVDGELPAELATELREHVAGCPDCRAEYESLERLAAALARPPKAAVPPDLWQAIERRLEGPSAPGPAPGPAVRPRAWSFRTLRSPLAAAAVIVVGIALGWLMLGGPGQSAAHAGHIDFRPLLAQADGDIDAGIAQLLRTYGGRPLVADPAAEGIRLRVHAPAELPAGLRLKSRLLLNMGRGHRALAFHYTDPAGKHLLLLQCPPRIEKDYGDHECLPCSISSYQGHGVRVGKLYLMHMDSPNVCVCVVSTLDEREALPAALAAVRIDF